MTPRYSREAYEQALRVLLQGTSGINPSRIQRARGVSRPAIVKFMSGRSLEPATVEKLAGFIWRQLNAPVLLCATDHPSAVVVEREWADVCATVEVLESEDTP